MPERITYIDSDGENITVWDLPPNLSVEKKREYFKQVENIFTANNKKIIDYSTEYRLSDDSKTPDLDIFNIKWTSTS